MQIDEVILAVVETAGKVEGRKRLQKMVHLLQVAGVNVPAEFRIHHYGPFSDELASVAGSMVLEGELEEEAEPVGPYDTYQYLYSAPSSGRSRINSEMKALIQTLDRYSTVELEVASTIAFFEEQGHDRQEAIEQTKSIKPRKTTARVLRQAEEILSQLRTSRRQKK
jgi:uncharacterized protein